LLLSEGRSKEAISSLLAVSEAKDPSLTSLLAQMLLKDSQYDGLLRNVPPQSSSIEVTILRSKAFMEQKRHDEALKELNCLVYKLKEGEIAANEVQQKGELHFQKASHLFELKKYRLVVQTLRDLERQMELEANWLCLRVKAEIKEKMFEEALEGLRKLERLGYERGQISYMKGACFEGLGREEDAYEAYEQAVSEV